jgi:RES domain-containing protein
MIIAWRIVGARYKDDAFSGEGARLRGGRWNSKGTTMVYTAGSIALASIEMLVNLPGPKLLAEFVRIPVHIPPDLIVDLPLDKLPGDWSSRPISPSIKAIGDRWVKDKPSAVLKVPSVVVPEEYNYLLNPYHPDFDKITIGTPIVYRFDPRLAH